MTIPKLNVLVFKNGSFWPCGLIEIKNIYCKNETFYTLSSLFYWAIYNFQFRGIKGHIRGRFLENVGFFLAKVNFILK